jgi:hypothetical protein
MNKESPKADAPVPLEGTEQALEQVEAAAKQKKPEESSAPETAGDALASDLISDAIDVVISIFD